MSALNLPAKSGSGFHRSVVERDDGGVYELPPLS